MGCMHEIPCTCDEYLEKITEDQLLNLRIEFGRVITDPPKAIATGNAIPMFVEGEPKPNTKTMNKLRKKEAVAAVKKVNQFLEKKFGYIII